MRAAVIDGYNKIPTVTDVPDPGKVPGTCRIAVSSAGLQPTDLLRVQGIYKQVTFPYIIGGEGVGLLESGERVYFGHSIPSSGALCQVTLVPEDEVWPIDDHVDEDQAIALAIAGTGALIPLEEAGIRPGERVLILGASGPVGQIASLAARRLGAGTVIGAARTRSRLDRLRKRGFIDEVVQLGQGDDDAALKAAAGPGYDVVFDGLFGPPAESAMRATALGARMMSIGTRAARNMTLTLRELRGRSHIGVDTGDRAPAVRRAAFERLLTFARQDRWVIDIMNFDLEDIPRAWAAQQGSPGAKIVVKVAR